MKALFNQLTAQFGSSRGIIPLPGNAVQVSTSGYKSIESTEVKMVADGDKIIVSCPLFSVDGCMIRPRSEDIAAAAEGTDIAGCTFSLNAANGDVTVSDTYSVVSEQCPATDILRSFLRRIDRSFDQIADAIERL